MNNVSNFEILFGAVSVFSVLRIAFVKNIYSASIFMLMLHFGVAGLVLNLGRPYTALVIFFSCVIFNVCLLSYGLIIQGALRVPMESAGISGGSKKALRTVVFLFVWALLILLVAVLTPFFNSIQVTQESVRGSLGEILLGKHILALQMIAVLCLAALMGSGAMFLKNGGKSRE